MRGRQESLLCPEKSASNPVLLLDLGYLPDILTLAEQTTQQGWRELD